jgi:drug/metabolite transporter (DMT)-like permease
MDAAQERGILKTASVYGALVLAACIYGGWALVAKSALKDGADPMVFAFYRCFGGAVVLLSAMLVAPNLACSKGTNAFTKMREVPQADWMRFTMLGIFMAANILGFILGASKLSALTCSIFQPTIPVFAMIFSVIFGVEQISKQKFAGVAFMIAGAMCVAAFGEAPKNGGASDHMTVAIGMLFILMNVSATGLYFVHNKDVVRTYEPVFATFLTYLVAAIVILAGTVFKVGFDSNLWLLGGSPMAWAGLAYAVCLTTALNYSLLAWANKQSSPVTTASASTVQPLAASTLSYFLLGVGLTTGQLVGALFITSGLLVMIQGQMQEAQAQEREALVEAKV